MAINFFISSWPSSRHKHPRLIELDQLRVQAVDLFFYLHVVGLVEFTRERVHSHFEQNAD
jgi:hypothetical protein